MKCYGPNDYEVMLIDQSLDELSYYARVFFERVRSAFSNLDSEADEVEKAAYNRMAGNSYSEDDDDSGICENAYHEGVDFYLATDAIRQGVFNLMVAGLYHLLEQQAAAFCRPHFNSRFGVAKPGRFPVEDLERALSAAGFDIHTFKSWPIVDELRLLANVIKHGGGNSEKELRLKNPKLFQTKLDLLDPSATSPFKQQLRPLIGEGLELQESHFTKYADALREFWEELRTAITPPPPA